MNKLKLGVNIDHVASLRQARGTSYPDIVEAARLCEVAGAHGITVHLREDRRHIQDKDVYALRKSLNVTMNLEMANNPAITEIALDVHPDEVCMVPERRQELTTEGGLDVAGNTRKIGATVGRLNRAGIVVSLFIAPDRRQVKASAEVGATYIELHTGTFCDARGAEARKELKRLIDSAAYARELGLKVNAGHGISLETIDDILQIPFLDTLNIGHSIVCHSVFVGMQQAVKTMLKAMAGYKGGRV